MRRKRRGRRHRRRLLTEFAPCGYAECHRGVSTSLSETGFFLKSRHVYRVGVMLEVRMSLSPERTCSLRGVVRYARKVLLMRYKNGMGVEILEGDPTYVDFIRLL
jgi:hypothetical protein